MEPREVDAQLKELRQALLRLHKTLLDWERMAYERFHGRQSSNTLLDALLTDPQFAWLRPMSQLIVRIDEMLADEIRPQKADLEAVLSSARAMSSPNETGSSYEQRYYTALQEHPDAIFAHRDLAQLIKSVTS